MAAIGFAKGLTGGGANDLDAILVANISDGDFVIVADDADFVQNGLLYRYDSAKSIAADLVPFFIIPDDNSTGTGAWELHTPPGIQLSLTANTTLTSQYLSPIVTIDNKGASGDLAHSLPAGYAGMRLRCVNASGTYDIKFTANGSETIMIVAADGYSSTSIAGGYVELQAGDGYQLDMYFNGTKWVGHVVRGTVLLETS